MEINATGDVTLHTAGKYCEEDILVRVPSVSTDELDAKYAEGYEVGNAEGYTRGHEEGYDEHEALASSLIARTATSYSNKQLKSIGAYNFYQNAALATLDAPNVTSIGRNAFTQCSKLKRAEFPKLTSMGSDTFTYCSALTYADIGTSNIPTWCFSNCKVLTAVVLRKTSGVSSLGATNAFSSTPVASGTGYVYVPAALVDSYKAATNWSTYAAQIRAIEDYPDIVGG